MAIIEVPLDDASAQKFSIEIDLSSAGELQKFHITELTQSANENSEAVDNGVAFEAKLIQFRAMVDGSDAGRKQDERFLRLSRNATTSAEKVQHGIVAAAIVLGATFSSITPGSLQRSVQEAAKPVTGFMETVRQWQLRRNIARMPHFLRRAYMRLHEIASVEQANIARSILAELADALPDQVPNLPPVHVAEAQSTILLEWIFPTNRLFFNIEEDAKESGWGFLSQSGEVIWGSFENIDYAALVDKVLKDA